MIGKGYRRWFLFAALMCVAGPLNAIGWASPESQAQTLVGEGAALINANKFAEATRKFRSALDLDPSTGKAYLGLCVSLLGEEKLDESMGACNDALKHGLQYVDRVSAYQVIEAIWKRKGKGAQPSVSGVVKCTTAMPGMPPAWMLFETTDKDGTKSFFCARVQRISTANMIRPGAPDNGVAPVRGPDGSLEVNGPFVELYPSGEKKTEGAYDSGQKSGKWIGYYRDGTVEWISDVDRSDHGRECQVRKEFYPTGEKKSEGRGWSCARDPGSLTSWYQDGTKKEVLAHSPFCAKAAVEDFYPNGQLAATGCGVEIKEGEWRFFDDAGNIVRVETYSGGKLDGTYTRFSKGQPVELGSYANGLKQGQWRTWDENTKLLTDEEYAGGVKLDEAAAKKARQARARAQREATEQEKRAAAAAAQDGGCDVSSDGSISALADFFGEVDVSTQPAPVSIGAYAGHGTEVLITVSSFSRLSPAAASDIAARFVRARSSQRGLGLRFSGFKTSCSAGSGLVHVVRANSSRR